jgi:acetyltransferase EpsM
VQIDSRIGKHAIVNTSASIDHDCAIGDYVHLAPGVHLAGSVRVGEGAFIGIGASVIPGITIGAGAVVGAGAAVIRDVPDRAVVVGVPARVKSLRSASPFVK